MTYMLLILDLDNIAVQTHTTKDIGPTAGRKQTQKRYGVTYGYFEKYGHG